MANSPPPFRPEGLEPLPFAAQVPKKAAPKAKAQPKIESASTAGEMIHSFFVMKGP